MELSNYDYIYLHGFASSPDSGKAKFYKNEFAKLAINIYLPDLNNNNFSQLTLSRQINQVQQIIDKCTKPVILIGSSMGGLTSCILAEENQQIAKIILLAPAFKISKLWQDKITTQQLKEWQSNGSQNIFHYSYGYHVPLNYEFYTDLFSHEDANFKRKIDCLIFHGKADNVVPIRLSQEYVISNTKAQLISLEDDHGISKCLNKMWDMSVDFICQ